MKFQTLWIVIFAFMLTMAAGYSLSAVSYRSNRKNREVYRKNTEKSDIYQNALRLFASPEFKLKFTKKI